MNFNSFSYMLFLPATVLLYFILPTKIRWAFLLGCSYFFYMCWNAKYALLMLASTVITFISGLLIAKVGTVRWKKVWVVLSFASNLAILFFFKYYNFLADTINNTFTSLQATLQLPNFEILLPVGISFYTFQALSYTMDVFRGTMTPTQHFGKYALFVSFFPQLVAGPIERSEHLLSQFDETHRFDFDAAKDGMLLILIGMFKKVMIADRLAWTVNAVFDNFHEYSGAALCIATVFFAFQIYCDFSGYSDIAIGSAKLMGFRLMTNFDRPYLADSISGFWQKWHISLSTWFRDYLYIPLGGNRRGQKLWIRNILIVFLVSGLWHGANWTFVMWGALHGLYQMIGKLTKAARQSLYEHIKLPRCPTMLHIGSWTVTFTLVCLAWIFFRAKTVMDAFNIVARIFTGTGGLSISQTGVNKYDFLLSLILIVGLFILEVVQPIINGREFIKKQILPVRWGIYYLMLFAIILFGVYGDLSDAAFIYFQF